MEHCLIIMGKPFQSFGAMTEKDLYLSPWLTVLVFGIDNRFKLLDHSKR